PGQPKALNRPTVHDFCTSDGHTASLSLADGEPWPPRATPLPATGSAPASLPALGDSHPGQTEPLALGICDWWRCRALSCRCDQAAVSTGEEDPLPRAEEDEEATWERAAAGPGRSGAGWRLCSFPCCCLWEPGVSTEESSADSDPLPRLPGPPCRGGRKMPVKKKRKSPGVAAAVAEDGGLKKCKISRCDCTEKLQNKFDFLRSQLNDISSFKNIYRYAFDFARDKDQRSLDIDTAKSMLALLLGRTWPLFSVFYQYLEGLFFLMNLLSGKKSVKHHSKNYCEENADLLILTCIEANEMRKTKSKGCIFIHMKDF
uniref:DCN1-like protein n=1 Tax=Equus asinus TaxID=9793 RepID=A0A8C4LUE0_EQUAS